MASVAGPYGARAVGCLSSAGSFTGKVRHFKIASSYATAIFNGDFVQLVAGGTVEKDTGTTSMTPVGIFLGCRYTDPVTLLPTWDTYWPAGLAADDAEAFVIDDPDVLFQMQGDGSIAQTELGSNFAVIQTAGSTIIKVSRNAVNAASSATTNTLPLRLIDFVDGPDSEVGDAFTDVIVKFNAGHQYNNTTGI